jgi:AmiR/NasT family two-component response regulator
MSRSLRIVIADDESDLRDYLQETLSILGHQVVGIAATGRELIEQARTTQPDLVITDIKMPEIDGIDAADEICRNNPIPIILVSAYHDHELVSRAGESHVLAYLVKPIEQRDLETTISIVMRRFEQFQDLRREAADLRQAMEDRKIIERAKGILMQRAELSEDEAYRRLNKTARDGNHKLRDVAQSILMAEDLLRPGSD